VIEEHVGRAERTSPLILLEDSFVDPADKAQAALVKPARLVCSVDDA
jgi:hypothetical protein